MIGQLAIRVLGVDAAVARIKALPAKLDAAERRATEKLGVRAESLWRRRASGSVLKVRSGEYRAGINSAPLERDAFGYIKRIGVRTGPASPYAKIHETGGTITPKRGKYLTIPVGDALKPGGGPRYSGPLDPELDSRDVFWIFPKGKNPRVVESDENEELSTLFVAVKQVTIPARRPMGQTLDEIRPLMAPTFEAEIKRAVGGV